MTPSSRVVGPALRHALLSIALLVLGCASGIDATRYVDGLRAYDGARTSARTLAQLDVTADGVVNADDAAVFARLEQDARALAQEQQVALGTAEVFYHGPAEGSASAFAALEAGDGRLRARGLAPEKLRELVIEARWLAGQARVAGVATREAKEQPFAGVLAPMFAGYDRETMTPGALCEAFANLDVQPFASAGVEAVAVADLDSTILQGNISDAFLAALVARGVPRPETHEPLKAFLKTLDGIDPALIDRNDLAANSRLLAERALNTSLPKGQRVAAKEAFEQTVALLAGLDVATVREIAHAAFEEGGAGVPPFKTRFFADSKDGCGTRKILRLLQQRGVKVYLLSATLDVLVEEAGRQLGVPLENVIGSKLEVVDGHYTGRVIDSTYYSKGSIMRQWVGVPPLLVFGDSPTSDVPMMLEAAGMAIMVNPRPDLLEADERLAGGRFVSVTFDSLEGAEQAQAN